MSPPRAPWTIDAMRAAAPGVLAISIAALLVGCASGETRRDRVKAIQALPVSTLDDGLALFNTVCVATAPIFADAKAVHQSEANRGIAVVDVRKTSNGAMLCSVRARTQDSFDTLQELQSRYGAPQMAGIAFIFKNTPYGDMLFQQGVGGGAGEGTYQLGLLGAR